MLIVERHKSVGFDAALDEELGPQRHENLGHPGHRHPRQKGIQLRAHAFFELHAVRFQGADGKRAEQVVSFDRLRRGDDFEVAPLA